MLLCGSIIFILFNSHYLRRRDAGAANASKLSVAVVGSRLHVSNGNMADTAGHT